ncbi:FtsX-like permease family protein [Actinoplanes sp. HUAS TT8]|uniref:FtsX-like permease family protein n=1 Tax=Actinoplanes sp. HUAS TT8 TaxID=3447453 RepID=UPI003F51D7BE
MIRLVLADFVANLRLWFGAMVVAAGTAAVGLVVAAQIQTALTVRGLPGAAIASMAGTVLVLGTVAGLVVLSSVTNLTVALQQRDYALWQLVGIRPAYVGWVVLSQLALVAVIGAVAGTALMFPALGPLFAYLYAHSSGLDGIHAVYGPAAALGALLFVVTVIILGGLRGARRVSRTAPIALLRAASLPDRGMTVLRWVTGGAGIAVAVPMSVSLAGAADPGAAVLPLVTLAGLISGILAAFGPLYLPRLVRAWTTLVPERASGSWFLARHTVADNVGRSAAAITPLMVAIALCGGVYAVSETLGGAVPLAFVLLVLGGPLVLSVLGATVTVLMAGRSREREVALIRAAGGTPGTVLVAAVSEAVIYVGTAALLGFAAVAVAVGVALVAAHGRGLPVAPSLGFTQAGTVALVGLILTAAATVIPTAAATRRSVSRELAAE